MSTDPSVSVIRHVPTAISRTSASVSTRDVTPPPGTTAGGGAGLALCH